jgi:hypothetical protein
MRFERALFHQIDLKAEGVAQFVLQAHKLKEGQGALIELNEEIEITARCLVPTGVGTENTQGTDAVTRAQIRE